MLKQINSIQINDRIRKNVNRDSVIELAADILKNGLTHPIVVTESGILVAGGRRLEAYKMLNKEEIEATVIADKTEEQLFDIEARENLERRSFVLTELYEVAKRKEVFVKAENKEAKKRKAKTEVCSHKSVGTKKDKETDHIVANYIGLKGTTYRNLKKVMNYEDKENFTWIDKNGDVQDYDKLLGLMNDTGKVTTALNKLFPKEKKEKEVVEETVTTDNNEELLKVIAEKDKIIAEKEANIETLKSLLDMFDNNASSKAKAIRLPDVSKESLRSAKSGILKCVHPDLSKLDKEDANALTQFFTDMFENKGGVQ
jgi:ParB family chromosome partitioning protein